MFRKLEITEEAEKEFSDFVKTLKLERWQTPQSVYLPQIGCSAFDGEYVPSCCGIQVLENFNQVLIIEDNLKRKDASDLIIDTMKRKSINDIFKRLTEFYEESDYRFCTNMQCSVDEDDYSEGDLLLQTPAFLMANLANNQIPCIEDYLLEAGFYKVAEGGINLNSGGNIINCYLLPVTFDEKEEFCRDNDRPVTPSMGWVTRKVLTGEEESLKRNAS